MMMPLREKGTRHKFTNGMKGRKLEEIPSEEKIKGKEQEKMQYEGKNIVESNEICYNCSNTNENILEEKIRKIMASIKISTQKVEEELLSMGEVVDIFTLQPADRSEDNSLKGIVSKFQEMKPVWKSIPFEWKHLFRRMNEKKKVNYDTCP